MLVAPSAGAWIEITTSAVPLAALAVAPSAGAWIEILLIYIIFLLRRWSLPPRERGLKLLFPESLFQSLQVAPSAGAWIEITMGNRLNQHVLSLPPRERGLKYSTRN